MTGRQWDLRIERARKLAVRHPFAAQGLRFYEQLASFQKEVYESLAAPGGMAQVAPVGGPVGPGALRDEIELIPLLPWFAAFLGFIGDIAPPPLAEAAAGLRASPAERWEEVIDAFWRDPEGRDAERTPHESLLAWAFLQPYAELRADRAGPLPETETPPICPRCGGKPVVGVLRPLGDGAKRSLVCALCATEWDYRRIVCPACGEENVDKLPIYAAEETPTVRVEACDTCHRYLKTIDLTKDGHAVPVVDELAALPLSVWAVEHGYEKIRVNLLGV